MSRRVVPIESSRKARAPEAGVKAVVLAGGKGTRLAPYTSILPKPLMPIGDGSILELVLGQLASCGINDVVLSVGYLAHLIEAVLQNGRTHGTEISYVYEEALGTAAPLRLVEHLDDTFILMNGDVLTTLDITDIVRHHRRSRNLLRSRRTSGRAGSTMASSSWGTTATGTASARISRSPRRRRR